MSSWSAKFFVGKRNKKKIYSKVNKHSFQKGSQKWLPQKIQFLKNKLSKPISFIPTVPFSESTTDVDDKTIYWIVTKKKFKIFSNAIPRQHHRCYALALKQLEWPTYQVKIERKHYIQREHSISFLYKFFSNNIKLHYVKIASSVLQQMILKCIHQSLCVTVHIKETLMAENIIEIYSRAKIGRKKNTPSLILVTNSYLVFILFSKLYLIKYDYGKLLTLVVNTLIHSPKKIKLY